MVLPSPVEASLRLRPLSGAESDVQVLCPALERRPLAPARFAPPALSPSATQDDAQLLSEALRLSLTRPAYIEADLRRIFEGEAFADFTALWLLLHASRFGPAAGEDGRLPPPSDCALERWRDAGQKTPTFAAQGCSSPMRCFVRDEAT